MKPLIALLFLVFANRLMSQSGFKSDIIFEPDKDIHGHVHASSIVELPNGDLLAAWYEGETDRSTDVRIQAARLVKGQENWSETFLLADTPMLSDNNPCLFIDKDKRLWLFYYTLLGSPEEAWDTAFIRYKISTEYIHPGESIIWQSEQDLAVIPTNLDDVVNKNCESVIEGDGSDPKLTALCHSAGEHLKSQLKRRLGWTTRAKPTQLSNGSLLLPMASETFKVALIALTSDGGEKWKFSNIPFGYGILQPALFETQNGKLIAYFRDSSPAKRIRMSTSDDKGVTWSEVINTEFPNPGSGLDVLKLRSGKVLLVYNDRTEGPRNSLAISVSDDDGRSWKWKKHIERTEGEGRFDYPAIIQGSDQKIHLTYSLDTKTIKHVIFTEEWIVENSK
jgi:predicted neuraminidase